MRLRHRTIVAALYVLLTLVLAVTTFVEWRKGTEFVWEHVYSSWAFAALIGALCLYAIFYVTQRMRGNIPSALLHVSLVVIAVGALLTKTLGVQGQITLSSGERAKMFAMADGSQAELPFELRLDSFVVVRYPGTDAPMDYKSYLSDSDGRQMVVSMNRVLSLDGYRFFQSSYTGTSSTLSVNYDPWGMTVSYVGYALLGLSFLWLLADPRGRFHRLVRRLSLCALPLLTLSCSGTECELPTVGKNEIGFFGNIRVLHRDRMAPFSTFATNFTLKLTGKHTYRGLTAEQVTLGWMLFPEAWKDEPMLKMKGSLPDSLGIETRDGRLAVAQLFDAERNYLLLPLLSGPHPNKCAEELNDKLQLIVQITAGASPALLPVPDADGVKWLAPASAANASAQIGEERCKLIADIAPLLRKAVESDDPAMLRRVCAAVIGTQHALAPMPAAWKAKLEITYNRIRPTTWVWHLSLTLGLLALIAAAFSAVRHLPMGRWATVALIAVACAHLLSLVARGIILGAVPMSNGFETMLALALCVMCVGLLLRRVSPFAPAAALLMSGFALLVADLGMKNPHVTPLMPVLHSPWLSIHVATIMMAYAALSMSWLGSAVALVAVRSEETLARMRDIGLVILYPALALLAVGIFIGAVWANESWGRYWAWDPKEVWALITLLVYAVPLHGGLYERLTRPRVFHIYMVLAFATVLMTYFGVNYLLGGLHGYGG